MRPAVFLDRDGVLTELIRDPLTGEYRPPSSPRDVALIRDVIPALRELETAGFELFLVSNQPDYAKGKATLLQIKDVQAEFDRKISEAGVHFRACYYCYHHPQGVVPGYSIACECRKPRPGTLLAAAREYDIDLPRSWMIGDRDTDIECGKAAGTLTILINYPCSAGYRRSSNPDFQSENLKEAAGLILHNQAKI